MVDIGLYVGYALLFVALLAALALPLVNSFQAPQTLIKTFVALGGVVAIYCVAFFISGSEVTDEYIALGVSDASSSRNIGAGLITLYITFGIAIVGVVASEITKAVK